MKKKYFAIALLGAVFLFGCGEGDNNRDGMVTHVVICWLKESGNKAAQDNLIAVSQNLGEIPGVASVNTGRVLPSERPIVDSTFDVAIVMTFKDRETLAAYLEHPDHKKAVRETLDPLVKKILVYDFTR